MTRHGPFRKVKERCCRTGVVAAIFYVSLLSVAAQAQTPAWECEAYAAPQITIRPIQVAEQYNNNYALDELRLLAGDPTVESAGLREMPVGLTVANLRLDSSFEIVTQSENKSGETCAQIGRLDVQFGFADTMVYIAHELPPYSCGYNEVLQHERTHLAIDQNIVAHYLPQLRGLMEEQLRRVGVVRARSPEEAEARIRQEINDYLKNLGANIASVREQYQRQFDSLAEYERLSNSCNGELAGLIRRALDLPSLPPAL